jgi:hypothetical protein
VIQPTTLHFQHAPLLNIYCQRRQHPHLEDGKGEQLRRMDRPCIKFEQGPSLGFNVRWRRRRLPDVRLTAAGTVPAATGSPLTIGERVHRHTTPPALYPPCTRAHPQTVHPPTIVPSVTPGERIREATMNNVASVRCIAKCHHREHSHEQHSRRIGVHMLLRLDRTWTCPFISFQPIIFIFVLFYNSGMLQHVLVQV